MPVSPTYPGVYVEEIPSGVRTIASVATSITLFVGWAPRGDVDKTTPVRSWAEYERQFGGPTGGLDPRSMLGYAVSHFFQNGGQQAVIARIRNTSTAGGAVLAAAATVTLNTITLTAKNPGIWAESYSVETQDSPEAGKFSIRIIIPATATRPRAVVEEFNNLSMGATDARFFGTVLDAESAIATGALSGASTNRPGTLGPSPFIGGNDGTVVSPGDNNFQAQLTAMAALDGDLDRIDLFNLMCVPGLAPETPALVTLIQNLQRFCVQRRAFLVVDCPENSTVATFTGAAAPNIRGVDAINSALYFPWVSAPDPLREGRTRAFPPCGFVTGRMAATDASRGIWKAPAGLDASVSGASGLRTTLTDSENGQLNIRGFNCLRTFPVYGTVVWGARTLRGSNDLGSEYKFVPVRRMALWIEETLIRATAWVVFEPNDEPLWSQIRLNIGTWMNGLFKQQAFQGSTAREAYFVKCDRETTTQADINLGIVNIHVGFAPLKPAEYVVLKISQIAGQLQT